jgi:hypothetical protein
VTSSDDSLVLPTLTTSSLTVVSDCEGQKISNFKVTSTQMWVAFIYSCATIAEECCAVGTFAIPLRQVHKWKFWSFERNQWNVPRARNIYLPGVSPVWELSTVMCLVCLISKSAVEEGQHFLHCTNKSWWKYPPSEVPLQFHQTCTCTICPLRFKTHSKYHHSLSEH